MELIVIVVILFVLVEGVYKRWLDAREQKRGQSMLPQLATVPVVHQAPWKPPYAAGER